MFQRILHPPSLEWLYSDARGSSEITVNYQTAGRHWPDDRNLNSMRRSRNPVSSYPMTISTVLACVIIT